jgi:hypothetical protein
MHRAHLLENLPRPKTAPQEYAGQWVAWDKQRTVILAHGIHLRSVHDAAESLGHPDASFERVPRTDEIFVGNTELTLIPSDDCPLMKS